MEIEPKQGHIEVICGGMFSGKTEELIRRVKRAEIAKQKIQVFKSQTDKRSAPKNVHSHDGGDWEAISVNKATEILDLLEPDTQVVAIDEAQFFDEEIVRVCNKLADEGRRVIVAGLDTDYKANPFGSMPELLAQAEVVEKLQAICMVCGAPASRSQRLVANTEVILIGATKKYEARCRHCHSLSEKS